MAKLLRLLIIYAVVAVVAYAVIYFVFLAPVGPMTAGGCVPTYYQACP